jgi:predicted transcriptional regulator
MGRTTIYLDEDLRARLHSLVPARGLNRFINEAVAAKVDALERQQVAEAMKEGYIATASDRAALHEDWGPVDLQDWPE